MPTRRTMDLHIRNRAFLMATIILLIQPTSATDNCTLKMHPQCRCSSNHSWNISISCTYENSSVIGQFIQEPTKENLALYEVTVTSTTPLYLPKNFFNGIRSIYSIKMANSSLIEIPEALSSLENVSNLDLSLNAIKIFNASLIYNWPGLESVVLWHNRISNITDTEIVWNENNRIEDINLSHNSLVSVSGVLRLWTLVRRLDISSNRLTQTFNIRSSSIEELNLSNNHIREIVNKAFLLTPNLKILNISHNNIAILYVNSFYGLENLQQLDASNNRLTSILDNIFLPVPGLTTLWLSHNDLLDLHAESYQGLEHSLQELSISGNNIRNVDDDTFMGLHSLTTLDISHNSELRDIRGVMYPAHISALDLSYCAITQINECQFFGLEKLAILKLNHNKFSCHCHMKTLYMWYQELMIKNQTAVQKDGNDWLCMDDTGVKVPIYSSLTSENCSSKCDTKGRSYVMDVDIDIDSHHESILVQWKINNTPSIYGFSLHIQTTNGETLESPLIHKDVRIYSFRMKMGDVSEFTLCLAVLGNRTVTLGKVCLKKEIPLDTVDMVTGIVAGVVFLIPCLVIFFYIIYKDKRYHKSNVDYSVLEGHIKQKHECQNSHKQSSVMVWAKYKIDRHHHLAGKYKNEEGKINTKDMAVGCISAQNET